MVIRNTTTSTTTTKNKYSLFSLFNIFMISLFLVPISLSEHPTNLFNSCLFSNHVKNFTIFPNSSDHYNSSMYYKLLNFSIQNLRFADPRFPKPIAIVLPETKQQLISTILCCRQQSLVIRIRCGGHSYEGSSSVTPNGVLFVIIDMMNLNQISVHLESETAWVQGGATLGETYYAIAKASESGYNGYGFSAGSCPTVGIGGHISGGGFGLLSRKYGLAADNVVDVLLINAGGEVLDRKAMGEDVFWAIRGGGGGVWGVIYAWKIRLLRVPQVVTSFIVSRPGTKYQVDELVHKWQFVGPKLEDDFYLSVFLGAGLPGSLAPEGTISATFKGFYLGSKIYAMSSLTQAFPQLGIIEEDCKEMSWIESVLYFSGLDNGSSISDLRDRFLHDKGYFKAKSDYVKMAISKKGIRAAIRILEKEPKGYVILDPYGGMMERISSDSISFPHREGNLFTIQYLVAWKEEEKWKSEECMDWIREFYKYMTPFVSKGPRAAYVNYLDLDLGVMEMLNNTRMISSNINEAVEKARVWGEKYFLRNYDRLVQAKTLIDPNNVFNNPQGIPPLSTFSLVEKM